jgi:NhaP-type Na+/H+ or K+/H+ antiporter
MSSPTGSPLTSLVSRLLPRLRYPYLFLILGGLFLIDLVIPDPVPLVDELLLAILTFIAATFTTRREQEQQPRDITPREDDGGSLTAGDERRPSDSKRG